MSFVYRTFELIKCLQNTNSRAMGDSQARFREKGGESPSTYSTAKVTILNN